MADREVLRGLAEIAGMAIGAAFGYYGGLAGAIVGGFGGYIAGRWMYGPPAYPMIPMYGHSHSGGKYARVHGSPSRSPPTREGKYRTGKR